MRGSKTIQLPIAAALSSWIVVGCTSTVEPPAPGADAVIVYLVRDSWHSGLRLPCDGGGYVEYGFGEWAWFAERIESNTGFLRAMLVPSRAAIARRELSAAEAADYLLHRNDGVVTPIRVDRRRAIGLRVELDDAWFQNRGDFVFDPVRRFDFREANLRYAMWQNCFDATAGWLRRLGCEVEHTSIRSGLRVKAVEGL